MTTEQSVKFVIRADDALIARAVRHIRRREEPAWSSLYFEIRNRIAGVPVVMREGKAA